MQRGWAAPACEAEAINGAGGVIATGAGVERVSMIVVQAVGDDGVGIVATVGSTRKIKATGR